MSAARKDLGKPAPRSAASALSEDEAAELGSELETTEPDGLEAFVARSMGTTDPLRAQLALFSLALSIAKRARLAGKISDAIAFEADASRIYDSLPKNARW